MGFAVIRNEQGWAQERRVLVEDVQAEARRRKKLLRFDELSLREFVNGTPVPEHVRNTALQIDFAALALARLSPIPSDYADDLYWPRMWLD